MSNSNPPADPRRRADRHVEILLGVAALLLIALGWVVRLWAVELPECAFRRWTGYPCMGCGSTRAVVALGRGDVLGGLRHNPLGAGAMIAALGLGVAGAVRRIAGQGPLGIRVPNSRRAVRIWLLVGGAFVLGNWAWVVLTETWEKG